MQLQIQLRKQACLFSLLLFVFTTIQAQNYCLRTGSDNPLSNLMFGGNPLDGDYPRIDFADINGDGDVDMVMGFFGPELAIYENTGTNSMPVYTFTILISDDPSLSIRFPTFVDIDGDGDFDLAVGESTGIIRYYENIGTASAANYMQQTGTANPFNAIDIGVNSRPIFADIDNDGDQDMIVGERDGIINYYENTGTASMPTFVMQTGAANPFDGISAGLDSSPTMADVDMDGDLDLLLGNDTGMLFYYENTGTNSAPNYVLQTGASNPFDGISGLGVFIRPELVDLNSDGDFDLVVAGDSGPIDSDYLLTYYENVSLNVTAPGGCVNATGTVDFTVTSDEEGPYTIAGNGVNTTIGSAGVNGAMGTVTTGISAAGTYTFSVTSASGCAATTVDVRFDGVNMTATASTASCTNNTGEVSFTITSDSEGPYTIAGNGVNTTLGSAGMTGVTGTIGTGISTTGSYTFTITSASGCASTTASTTVGTDCVVNLSTTASSENCPSNTGKIEITIISGEVGPYAISGDFTGSVGDNTAMGATGFVLTGLTSAGTYTYTVTAPSGVMATGTVTISADCAAPSGSTLNVPICECTCASSSSGPRPTSPSFDGTCDSGECTNGPAPGTDCVPYRYCYTNGQYTGYETDGADCGPVFSSSPPLPSVYYYCNGVLYRTVNLPGYILPPCADSTTPVQDGAPIPTQHYYCEGMYLGGFNQPTHTVPTCNGTLIVSAESPNYYCNGVSVGTTPQSCSDGSTIVALPDSPTSPQYYYCDGAYLGEFNQPNYMPTCGGLLQIGDAPLGNCYCYCEGGGQTIYLARTDASDCNGMCEVAGIFGDLVCGEPFCNISLRLIYTSPDCDETDPNNPKADLRIFINSEEFGPYTVSGGYTGTIGTNVSSGASFDFQMSQSEAENNTITITAPSGCSKMILVKDLFPFTIIGTNVIRETIAVHCNQDVSTGSPPQLVPTMSEWGLFLFGLFMANLSLVFIYHKRRAMIEG